MAHLYDNLRQKNLKEIDKHKSFSFLTQNQADDLIKEQQSEKEKNILNKHIDNINKITQKSKKRI